LAVAALVLPILISVVLGTSRLLGAMSDEAGSLALNRVALGAAVFWAVDLIVLLIVLALIAVDAPHED